LPTVIQRWHKYVEDKIMHQENEVLKLLICCIYYKSLHKLQAGNIFSSSVCFQEINFILSQFKSYFIEQGYFSSLPTFPTNVNMLLIPN